MHAIDLQFTCNNSFLIMLEYEGNSLKNMQFICADGTNCSNDRFKSLLEECQCSSKLFSVRFHIKIKNRTNIAYHAVWTTIKENNLNIYESSSIYIKIISDFYNSYLSKIKYNNLLFNLESHQDQICKVISSFDVNDIREELIDKYEIDLTDTADIEFIRLIINIYPNIKKKNILRIF